jgi:AbrB family looped-hinge helix DNA binding protein
MSAPISTKVGKDGRIVIPAEMRRQLDLKDGDAVQISVENRQVVITPRSQLLRQPFEEYLADGHVSAVNANEFIQKLDQHGAKGSEAFATLEPLACNSTSQA